MPEEQLKAQLKYLRQTLNDPNTVLTELERSSLQDLAERLEARLLVSDSANEALSDPSLVDGVNLMIEEFSERHPMLATTLQNVVQALSNMGI